MRRGFVLKISCKPPSHNPTMSQDTAANRTPILLLDHSFLAYDWGSNHPSFFGPSDSFRFFPLLILRHVRSSKPDESLELTRRRRLQRIFFTSWRTFRGPSSVLQDVEPEFLPGRSPHKVIHRNADTMTFQFLEHYVHLCLADPTPQPTAGDPDVE